MCRNVRISITAGLAAAFVLAVCPLAAQAKTSTGHNNNTNHSSGNNTNKGAKSNGTMHTAPYTKVSHDSSKGMHDYKHKDTQNCHTDHNSHYCKDHDHCKDHEHYCKDHDHYCKDRCHDHDFCHDRCWHDHCHDWCHDWCTPCGFCRDFPCFQFGCDVGCDFGCDFGCEVPCDDCQPICQPVCQPACGSPVIIINNNDNPGSDDNVVIDQ